MPRLAIHTQTKCIHYKDKKKILHFTLRRTDYPETRKSCYKVIILAESDAQRSNIQNNNNNNNNKGNIHIKSPRKIHIKRRTDRSYMYNSMVIEENGDEGS